MNKMYPVFKDSFNSISPLSTLREFDLMFDNFFNTSRNSRSSTLTTVPRANVIKNENGYSIELAAPGFSRDDFELSVENNTLSITVNCDDTEEYNSSVTMREYSYQSFTRSWTLPEYSNFENISARYEAGILYVDVPMSNMENKKRLITVD